jgi:hypothetical protein
MGYPPWHMWGNAQTIQITSVGPSTPVIPVTTQQLLQVMYARPESWRFFCAARLLTVVPAAGVGGLIDMQFEIQMGMGRSTIIIPNFVNFQWDPNTDVTQQRWTDQAVGSIRFNGDTQPLPIVDVFTAQNIQALARTTYVQLPGPFTATIEIAMQVAPATHIRPEWYAQDPHKRFRAGEQGGM